MIEMIDKKPEQEEEDKTEGTDKFIIIWKV